MVGYIKATKGPNETTPPNGQWSKLDKFEQQDRVALDYNPKYKIPVSSYWH